MATDKLLRFIMCRYDTAVLVLLLCNVIVVTRHSFRCTSVYTWRCPAPYIAAVLRPLHARSCNGYTTEGSCPLC